jgi:hypothetical protein
MNRRRFFRYVGFIVVGSGAAGLLRERLSQPDSLRVASSRPELWGDGLHNDGPGLQALIDGEEVFHRGLNRVVRGPMLPDGQYAVL